MVHRPRLAKPHGPVRPVDIRSFKSTLISHSRSHRLLLNMAISSTEAATKCPQSADRALNDGRIHPSWNSVIDETSRLRRLFFDDISCASRLPCQLISPLHCARQGQLLAMYLTSSASALGLLALFSPALAQVDCPYTPQWAPCLGTVPAGIDCASMDVPMDWTDENKTDGYITLRLVRRRAMVADANVDSAPAIIINPGYALPKPLEARRAVSVYHSVR
jgi:hypothetical protein